MLWCFKPGRPIDSAHRPAATRGMLAHDRAVETLELQAEERCQDIGTAVPAGMDAGMVPTPLLCSCCFSAAVGVFGGSCTVMKRPLGTEPGRRRLRKTSPSVVCTTRMLLAPASAGTSACNADPAKACPSWQCIASFYSTLQNAGPRGLCTHMLSYFKQTLRRLNSQLTTGDGRRVRVREAYTPLVRTCTWLQVPRGQALLLKLSPMLRHRSGAHCQRRQQQRRRQLLQSALRRAAAVRQSAAVVATAGAAGKRVSGARGGQGALNRLLPRAEQRQGLLQRLLLRPDDRLEPHS